MIQKETCTAADRHAPKLTCGYPLPCPHHTVVVVIGRGVRTITKVQKKRRKK